ncbi:hypothetical protein [Micropruina glycogenica]|uniref:PPi-type phosphoenolpyruvate carboxykinase n=1 Tax=Micropruina glycogenica TaxID=75385 RepID=A0A2N9JK44_9ACTN|nr:hypothetical protein [Micropruina glycogenica]SPD88424.1 PPi-type phosphoenolpyruvate carboxykinase [Micropruina glycogenica]
MPSEVTSAAVNLRLALIGLAVPVQAEEETSAQLVAPILARQRELSRRLSDRLCAADQRIQTFLDDYLADVYPGDLAADRPMLPRRTLVLDEPGLARAISLPVNGDSFSSPLLSSYRLANGVLHNPANDRRTTAGVFHIAEGGLPIPDDKIAAPKAVFGRLLTLAFRPPEGDLVLPYLSHTDHPAACFVSLLLRPLVSPAVPGYATERRMETRFIVPGGLVANLDFVEGIFGNGGDPYLPEHDASLDPGTWTGTTGCVILAPHLTRVTKKELGLPHIDDATPRQRRDGMCWSKPDERYNGGQAFKICARDARGVMVTVIADNYFGYCKKEVKTQISYTANLFGNVEEEHAGGALVFPSYNIGSGYTDESATDDYRLDDVLARDPHRFVRQPEGHAIDLEHPEHVLVPSRPTYSLRTMTVSWNTPSGERSIRLRADKTYFGPNGYRVQLAQSPSDPKHWDLKAVVPNVTSCHKPCTVSGGGKSEISKAITDAFIFGNAYTADFDADMDAVEAILARDHSDRFADEALRGTDTRAILSPTRSIGSVIKLLTPSDDFTDAYNEWLESIPPHVKELVFVVKRFHRPEWGGDWRSHFTVGIMNGRQGNALRLDGERINVNMLRVGFDTDGSWRLFGLRHDFNPAVKVQTEDDITASIVGPAHLTAVPDGAIGLSRKYVQNCENLLFQRPDDAIHRGYDKQTELDMSGHDNFLSNFEPLTRFDAREMRDDAVAFSAFTTPMQQLLAEFADQPDDQSPRFVVSSANPRLVGGKPSKNPRYLQKRPDLTNAQATAAADLAMHLLAKLPSAAPMPVPVDVVAAGRRNNPPDGPVPALCSYNPLHYMELPELFMEYISSMTGKSPSTTGAGSEGALTKGPFNAMPAIVDLNAALLSYVLTGYDGWVSCAGYVGPNVRVDHDISMLIPEVFSRMTDDERSAANLIAEGCLERVEDTEIDGRPVRASRLGYRMTQKFARKYFGRIFLHPHVVFTADMLRPELQDEGIYADSLDIIVETHRRVAQSYFDDGTIELAIPPLRALLEIMANGTTADGHDLDSAEVRGLFDRDTVLNSDWYAERLDSKRQWAQNRAQAVVDRLEGFAGVPENAEASERLDVPSRLTAARAELDRFGSDDYRAALVGTLGRQPL